MIRENFKDSGLKDQDPWRRKCDMPVKCFEIYRRMPRILLQARDLEKGTVPATPHRA